MQPHEFVCLSSLSRSKGHNWGCTPFSDHCAGTVSDDHKLIPPKGWQLFYILICPQRGALGRSHASYCWLLDYITVSYPCCSLLEHPCFCFSPFLQTEHPQFLGFQPSRQSLQEQRVTPNNSLLSSVAATLGAGTWRVTTELLRMATTQQASVWGCRVVGCDIFFLRQTQQYRGAH